MLVSLKNGKDCRFCLLKDDYHKSNRIFFYLKLKSKKQNKSEIRLCCYDLDCKKILDTFHKERKELNKNKNKKILPIKKEGNLTLSPMIQMLLFKTTKEIPALLRRRLLQLLNIKTNNEDLSITNDFEKNIHEQNSCGFESLRYNSKDGESLPVPLYHDKRIGIMVTKEELSLPLPTKKRNIIELNESYYFEGCEKKVQKEEQPIEQINYEQIKLEFEGILNSWDTIE